MATKKAKQTAWSYSRLNGFETCPKKFWHLSVRKDIREAESEAMRYGKMVHKALELRVGKNKPMPLNLRYLDRYAKTLAEAKGNKLTEQQLAIDNNFEPCDWFSKDTWCRAIIDLAIVNGTHAIVIDYKTGKISSDFTQLRLAGVLLMLHMPEIQTVDLAYLWTKDKKMTKYEDGPLTRDDIKHVVLELMPRLKKYEKAHRTESFPARPGFLCKNWCPVTTCGYHGE
jgi:CRISPR/Cas system-associated exonuclease Cas4 (RecB family)